MKAKQVDKRKTNNKQEYPVALALAEIWHPTYNLEQMSKFRNQSEKLIHDNPFPDFEHSKILVANWHDIEIYKSSGMWNARNISTESSFKWWKI